MPCRSSAEFSNHWSEKTLAAASILLFRFGTKKYPDSNETFRTVKQFVDDVGLEYFLLPKVSLDFPVIYGSEDQAPDAQISLDWQVEGRRLRMNLTSDGYSSYTESFPGRVGKSGPLSIKDPTQLRALLVDLVGVELPD
jgi:hypothetical protein